MTFESWGHTTAQLLFKWKEDELKVNPSVTEGLNQHSTFVKFIDRTYGTNFSTGKLCPKMICRFSLDYSALKSNY